MSQYEDYARVASNYDSTRRPVGLDCLHAVVDEVYAELKRPLRIVDIGCGTGNYARALLERHGDRIGTLVGIDGSAEMLKAARTKLKGSADIELVVANLHEPLPLDDGQFDIVVCTQVIHHLSQDEPWAPVAALLAEMHRVLRPGGGRLHLNFSTAQQQHFWFQKYLPTAAMDRMKKRFQTREWMSSTLQELGFDEPHFHSISDLFMDPSVYERPDLAHDKTWRDGDSTWAMINEEELARSLESIAADVASGRVNQVLEESRQMVKREGLSLTVVASRK